MLMYFPSLNSACHFPRAQDGAGKVPQTGAAAAVEDDVEGCVRIKVRRKVGRGRVTTSVHFTILSNVQTHLHVVVCRMQTSTRETA